MPVKLSNKELELMSAASLREDRSFDPPKSIAENELLEIAAKFAAAGLVREIKAKTGAPVWHRDEDAGKSFALKLTAAGQKVVAAEANMRPDVEDVAIQGAPDSAPNAEEGLNTIDALVEPNAAAFEIEPATSDPAPDPSAANAPREGTKISIVLRLLQRNEGATLDEVISATGWLPHTSRAALTGLRKRGYGIERRSRPEGGSAYAVNVSR